MRDGAVTMHRRIRLDLATPTEVAIRSAVEAVEAMPADTRLTQAGLKLTEALDLVASYVDEQMRHVDMGEHEVCGLLVNGGSEGRCRRQRGHDGRCVGGGR